MECVFCGEDSHSYRDCPEKITPHSSHIYATPMRDLERKKGDLILPPDKRTTAPKRARIISVDPRIEDCEVKEGDVILYPANLAWKMNDRLFRIFEANIMGIITE